MTENMIRAACDSTERFVEGVGPDHYDLPTPCAEWDVRALLNHLLGTFALGEALLGDRPPSVEIAPGEVPAVDLVGDEPLKAYRAGVEGLLAVTDEDAVTRMHTTPLGEMPGAALAGFTALDILVHGWDLAKATGQDATLDPRLAEDALAFARQAISDEMSTRAPLIGPEVACPGDASTTDRLVAFLGRTP